MTEQELIVLAALATGVDMEAGQEILVFNDVYPDRQRRWDPLGNSGDALRLAVAAGIEIHPDIQAGETQTAFMAGQYGYNVVEYWDDHDGDSLVATCRAITRSAAKIGKQLKEKNHD